MENRYYQILDLSPEASKDDLKAAFRRKAKLLHPDQNKCENAHEEFIFLNEAYEYIFKKISNARNKKSIFYTTTSSFENKNEWEQKNRERVKARARKYSKMKYDRYIKTDEYKSKVAINILLEYFPVCISIAAIILVPVIGFLLYGIDGLINNYVLYLDVANIGFVLLIFWKSKYTFSNLLMALKQLSKTPAFQISSSLLINGALFYYFTINTLINSNVLILLFLLIPLKIYIILWITSNTSKKVFLSFFMAPLILNCFFMLNIAFAKNTQTETYPIEQKKYWLQAGPLRTIEVTFEDQLHSKNKWIRLFKDYEECIQADNITYTFADGPFGLRTMKGYEFVKKQAYKAL